MVDDLSAAEAFYAGVLQCRIGRASEGWIDFDLMGHQVTVHRCEAAREEARSPVDGESVAVPHFGLILEWEQWEALVERLRACGAAFDLEPTVRFRGETGEQATAFVRDPAGNVLEFKAFRDPGQVFARPEDRTRNLS
ncbi:MAG: VOC family protein [Gammaproteobacteria bacterium]|nr:VOC family protein [Gammaproteobacteria bacterium]